MKKIFDFCQNIKKLARNFENFNDFKLVADDIGRTQKILKKPDFVRLVNVAAMEANLD